MVKTAFTGDKKSSNQTEEKSSTVETTTESTMTQGTEASHLSFQLTSHKLNGKNYLEWSQSVKLAIDGRCKLGLLNGEVEQPQVGDPKMSKWRSENSMVIAWLINSMEASIGKPFLFLPTAKDVWDSVKDTYSDLENASQIFELKIKLWKARQGEKEVTLYYNEMMSLWQELDQCYNDEWECPGDGVKAMKKEENERAYLFLAGLNKKFDEVISRILGKKPLPKLREFFSEVRREETRRKVMLKPGFEANDDNSALVTIKNNDDSEKKKKPWCDHCKKYWHTCETCWKLHGKPTNGRKKNGNGRGSQSGDSRAFQTTNGNYEGQSSLEGSPFTKEQLEHLHKFFQSPQFRMNSSIPNSSNNPSSSFAQSGTDFSVFFQCQAL
ncbi:hypothetical protein PVK06_039604 [Gossypium arboreum]|uniref:Retrotransposon Copia-like N-terminal domain-containing protein n=1 Tax=Gossypium arboreum TaxID=29729 RepID=A0ABR0N3C1_GOSAR|nr:hypothetical protein PVK06_039604 [Gossypium arboreum]